MRKQSAVLAALALLTVGLAGCSVPAFSFTTAFDGVVCDRAGNSVDPTTFGEVSDEFGTTPSPKFTVPVTVDETVYTDLLVGDGVRLSDSTQLAIFDIAMYSGATGELVYTTSFDGSVPLTGTAAQLAGDIPGFTTVLGCATGGTRTVAALSPEDVGDTARATFGLDAEESLLTIVDVRDVYLARATGRLQFNDGHGLPSVVRAPDGRPGVVIPQVDPPTELVTQVLVKGEGETVNETGTFRAHYTGLTWNAKTVFDSSWGKAPVQFSLDRLVKGAAEALRGQTVGSQIMVIVPPELGYGDTPQGSIPAGSTLVFIFDILGNDAE